MWTHFLNWEIVPAQANEFPLVWESYFARPAPLAVEIGFGNGEYLREWALVQPAWNLLGFELSLESMERCLKRLTKDRSPNARAVYCDARFALRELFAAESLDHVIMNFPDPWPKNRHRERRVISNSFIESLAFVLRQGCSYELVTDQQWYAEKALGLFTASPWFDGVELNRNPQRPVSTKYERKWRSMGRETWQLLAKKKEATTPKRLLEEGSMPHVFLDKEPGRELVFSLKEFSGQQSDRLFTIKGVFQRLEKEGYLLRVVAKDVDYKQSFYVVLNAHEDTRWIVKLEPAGPPYRTPAVKMAVWEIGRKLRELQQG